MTKIAIVTTLVAEFIGDLSETPDSWVLRNPLRVQVVQGPDGRMGGAFTPVSMFEELDTVSISKVLVLSPPRPAPKQAVAEYTRVTSGIILPG